MLKLGKMIESSLMKMGILNRVFMEGVSESFTLEYES